VRPEQRAQAAAERATVASRGESDNRRAGDDPDAARDTSKRACHRASHTPYRRPVAKRAVALGRAFRNRWRQSFVLSITVLVLVAVAVFALVIGRVVSNQIEDQSLQRARETAGIVARSSFAPRLPPPGKPLAKADRADLDRQLAAARAEEPGLSVRLWAPNATVIYGAPGATPPPAVLAALRGRPATDVHRDGATDTSPGATVTSAVPIRRANGEPVAAALELRLPYAPIGKDIRTRTRRLYLALLIAALAAYALALPALIRAGRAVRAQYDPRRVALMRDVRRGMKEGAFEIHYHPIADAQTGAVCTAEALVRWRHPGGGVIQPDRFIPALEPTEQMWPLTVHVFDLVVRQARVWADAGIDVRTAVNVSTADVIDPRLPGELHRLFDKHGVRADRLEIEVTEGAVMDRPQDALAVLAEITHLGVGVLALDDFGTGYSSLARLQDLPLDELKIDRSFVMRMASEGDETLVRSIVDLGHALGFRVIAEGVEAEETWRRLAELGADYVQGYVMTPPLPADEFTDWLIARSSPGSEKSPRPAAAP
jgi:EAL domain-containing protein (putative c-di-GMP-specific phosphodiesterase class I)